MTKQALLNKVIAIEAFAGELKSKASGLRKILARVYGPAPAGANKSLSVEQKARLVGNRKKSIVKKQVV